MLRRNHGATRWAGSGESGLLKSGLFFTMVILTSVYGIGPKTSRDQIGLNKNSPWVMDYLKGYQEKTLARKTL
jgi:hypothetical protein